MERSDRVNDTGGLGTVGGLARDGGGGWGAECSDLLIDRAFTFFLHAREKVRKEASRWEGNRKRQS